MTWWRRLLEGEDPIDTSAIADRDAKGAQAMQSAWQEAHQMFKEKVREHKKIEIE